MSRRNRADHIAATIATEQLTEHAISVDWLFESPRWAALVDALLAELPEHITVMTLAEEVAVQDRIKAGLHSAEDRKAFSELCDWQNTDEVARCEAAFLVGVEMGRRLGRTS
jgi:hypothetical protein